MAWDAYTARVGEALAPLGVEVAGVHESDDAVAAVRSADAIAVGGGNTFHLLATMQRTGRAGRGARPRARRHALSRLERRLGGRCPTLGTTNDMPIVEPPAGFGALGLVRFQINAHFTDAHPPGFQGETRASG
jgi:dipeptidase E